MMDMTLFALVSLALAGFVFIRFRARQASAEAHRRVAAGALLVDVRTPEEFAAGHLEGAINLPLQALEQKVPSLGAHETSIVLYCASGMRSSVAEKILAGAGYRSLYNLGAMRSW